MTPLKVITLVLVTDGLIVMMSRLLRAIMGDSMAYLIMRVYMCSHTSRFDRAVGAMDIMSPQTATRQQIAPADCGGRIATELDWQHSHLRSLPTVSSGVAHRCCF